MHSKTLRDPGPAEELRIPSPVLQSTSSSESGDDDFQIEVRMTAETAESLSILTTWFAGRTQHPAGVAIQPVQGTVQGPYQSANSCTSRASFPVLGKSAISSTYGIETAGSCQKAGSCCLFFLESRRIEPLSHASPQETGSSKGQTVPQRSTGRRGGKA